MKALLRKIVPHQIWRNIQKFRAFADLSLAKLCVKNKVASSLFYAIFSGQFHREHQSVLAGRLAYLHSLNQLKQSSALLRRNTHRLEKGLIMEPRKPSFAEGYIVETVAIFQQSINQPDFDSAELTWAQDVLIRYFSVVTDTPVIAKARASFAELDLPSQQANSPTNDLAASFSPYASQERAQSEISAQDLYQLFKQRRSVRWYQNRRVNVELVEQAIDMAVQAPSACNRQPFEFFTCLSPSVAAEIASIPTGTKGFSDNVPALIVIMGDLSAYPYERDRHVIYIDGGLVAMQLMLAFESLGLSTCPINWPDIELNEAKLAKRLALKPYQRPIMMMAVGYAKPEGGIPYSQKKSAKQLLKVVS